MKDDSDDDEDDEKKSYIPIVWEDYQLTRATRAVQ